MAKRPSFQFYPADWRNNAKLRRCSDAARGAWMDVLCVLHDSDEYGVCRWPLADLARAAGVPLKLAKELADKDVLKGADKNAAPYIYTPRHAGKDGEPVTLVDSGNGPCWYCSRFVRDEWVRQRRGAGTRFDSENQPSREPPPKKAAQGTERAQLRAAVLDKTGGTCYHCNCHLDGAWEIDHLVPRSKGGSNVFSNLVPSCIACNQDKSDSMPSDWSPPTRSPTRRVGERQGDGSTSTSSSTPKPSTPSGVGGEPPKTAEQMTKDELWSAGKSLLEQGGMPRAQCGAYVGKLVKDYDSEIVVEAVRRAVVERPADPVSFLRAVCQTIAGERKSHNRQDAREQANRDIAAQVAAEIEGAAQ